MSGRIVHQCECPNCQQPGKHPDKELHHQMNLLLSRLDEQQRRWYVALEAKKLGHGGITLLFQITEMSADTIRRGRDELDAELDSRPVDGARLPGGERPRVEKKQPGIEKALEKLIEDETGGNPMTAEKWVRSTWRQLSERLSTSGFAVGM